MTTLSAEAVGNNIYLLTEILLRLPVKPLVRSKCVSKQWLSIISDPQFCLSHNRHHHSPYPTPTALLVNKNYPENLDFKIIPLKHDTICMFPSSLDYLNIPRIKILQFCNGLLLCYSWYEISGPPQFEQLTQRHIDSYFVCNPITKQFKKLPFPSSEFLDSAYNLSLAFDPLKSIHYKITAFLRQSKRRVLHERQCQIYIYSSETDSWSPTEIIFSSPITMRLQPTIFFNGAIYWSTWDVNFLYFDVDTECLNTLPKLDDRYSWCVQYFGESRGHLHLIVKERNFELVFDVLEMGTDYSGWFVRYHVNLDAMRIVFPTLFFHGEKKIYNSCSVLCVIRAEKEEESTVVLSLNGKAISCNVSDGKLEELSELESKSKVGNTGFDYVYNTNQFFETLSCV